MQKVRQDLAQDEVHHKLEIQLLKEEYEEKLNQLQKKSAYLKHQLKKEYLLADQ